ncbi:MAG: hypothetical protein QXH75_07100 [Sulfolobaceae archaeon]
MIILVKYRVIDKRIRAIVNLLREIPFIKEIIFYKAEKTMISANDYKIWEEGSNSNPIEEIYDIKIFEILRRAYFPACS